MNQKVMELNAAEQAWLRDNAALARIVAEEAGCSLPESDRAIDPGTLDTAWANWMNHHDPSGDDDGNIYINAFGVAFGSYLVERLGLVWRVVEDEHGTEMAVWAREGDVLIFPPNLVAKRYVSRELRFFAAVAAATEQQVANIRASVAGSPQKQSQLGKWFKRSG